MTTIDIDILLGAIGAFFTASVVIISAAWNLASKLTKLTDEVKYLNERFSRLPCGQTGYCPFQHNDAKDKTCKH